MTNPSEVVVSDEEIEELRDAVARGTAPYIQVWRKAVAKLIAKRVPDDFSSRAMEEGAKSSSPAFNGAYMLGYNECRERVLKGE